MTDRLHDLINYAHDLVHQLENLPNQVHEKELEYHESQKKLQEIKLQISQREVQLFRDGEVDNKNELTRMASLFPHTEHLHQERIQIEHETQKKKSEYYLLKNKMENIRIIAKLLIVEQ